MLTLPFLVFSSWAGHVADHFSKKRMMVCVKVAEIVIMSAGFVAFWLRSPILLLVLLFFMGAQSAFFSPAKYGFLPETLAPEWLSRGNGKVQMWTFLAIILGTATAGGLADICGPGRLLGPLGADLHWAAGVCVLIAVLGTLTSLYITPTPPGHQERPNAGRGLPTVWRTLKEIGHHRILRRCLLGNAYFWFLAALFQLNILLYAQKEMGASELFVGILQATVALGIGLGSDWAGRVSGDHIEFRLVPLGALGMAIFSFLLFFVPHHPFLAMATLASLGASAGFFSLPLSAAIQRYSPEESRGRYLGTNNFVTFSAMTLAAAFLALVLLPDWVRPGHVFALSSLSAVGVLVVMFRREPSFLSRFAMWLVPAPFYKLRVEGGENVSETGGALLVCNHISFADAPLVQSALRRPVRFLIHKSYYEKGFFKFFASRLRCIPVAAEDRPKELIASLRAATEAIRNGEIVCIFPESMISRLGTLLPFRRGIELIMRRLDAPIVPMALGGLWGDQLSFRWGSPTRQGLRRLLTRPLRWPVTARIGAPLPASTPSWQVRAQVAELLLAADATTRVVPPTPVVLLLQQAKGKGRWSAELPPACRARFRRQAIRAIACAQRLQAGLRDRATVRIDPSLVAAQTTTACLVAALLGKTIREEGGDDLPALGSGSYPLETPFGSRLRAAFALDLLPVSSLAERLGGPAAVDPQQPLIQRPDAVCTATEALAAAQALADGVRLQPDDTLSFAGFPPVFAAFLPLFCGCRVGDAGTGTVLVGTAETLTAADGGSWRMALLFGGASPEQRAALAACLGCPVLRISLAAGTGVPELVECLDIVDGIVHQAGHRPGTDGLAPPGSFVAAVDGNGQPLPPDASGLLRRHYHTGSGPAVAALGTGVVDAEGFVRREGASTNAAGFSS
jgi:acyl-[acyl-carrier-protein]-phospholipid O-acyltransferase/long-chain-fatty-acid--[acyl-carrier-protein] ligase